MKYLILILSLGQIISAETIWSEDFASYSDNSGYIGSGSGAVTTGDYPSSVTKWTLDVSAATLSATTDWFMVNSSSGNLFESRDTDGECIWTSESITITGYTGVGIQVSVTESGTHESSDYVKLYYKLDGGSETIFETNGNNVDDFTSVTASHSNLSGSTLQIIIKTTNNAGSEYLRFDDIIVTGTASGSVNDPSSLSASVQSSSQIDLTWTDNANSDNVLLAWNSSSTFGTPTDGSTYSVSGNISGGGTVLQYSATDSYSHTSLTGNTAYYYKAWSYDGSNYSSGITTNVTTVKVEPTNHPTSLTATTSYQSIALAWTDAVTGSQAPDGYLILGETDATITDPTDGTAVSNDTDASDNTLAMSITHGAGASYTFSSLTASTTYYFEIFSYTNSGSSIDYKTDGTIITANATTGVAPVFVINEIHADPDATNGDANGDAAVSTADDEFVEIVNRSGSSVDISNWVITDGFSDRHVVTNGTTIGDGVSLVVFGGGTPTNIPGISQVASTGALGLNNSGDDVTLKDSEGGTIVTYSYGSEGGDNQSIARNPDYTGDFVRHSTITGNAVLFSPGKTNTGDVSLPVDLSYFTASSARSDEITLNWVTESELENLGFIVERRNTNVESLWGVIADYMSHPELQGQGSVAHRTEYTFTDNTVEVDQAYDYRLADVSFDGEKEYHHLYVLDVSSAELPVEFQLLQNYPNPFNPSTTLSYALPEQTMVKLMVFDIRGQEVLTLYDASQQPGHHQVLWKGIDKAGMRVNTGVYFARLEAGEHSKTMKMVYLR